ncbi:unnamed protein product [Anisakis simplex]|uniref:DHC_N2 domain-containing protein n=1 Tax=Anisakis simplex TaxID=6269 RepID=A0A0M3J6P5_ANISI|nr:unnamed protein product [Anisakis simplex]
MVKCVKASVNEWLPEINGMRAELHLPPFEVYHYPAESVGLYRALDKERQRLKSLKEDRVNGQRQMVDEVRSIAMRIGEEAGELPDVQKVWENDILTTLQERVVELSRELSERIGKARQWQTDLQRWFHQTGKKPEDDDATKVFLELDLEDPERVFDQSFMDNFKDVHQSVCNPILRFIPLFRFCIIPSRLDDHVVIFTCDAMVNYEEWIELAQFSYVEAIVKLDELWEQCHIPQTIRQFPREFNPSTHTASDLAKIQQEVEKLSRFHQERQDVYAKLKEWKTLWMEKVEYESHASDKSAYTNRGGQLQVTLQVYIRS